MPGAAFMKSAVLQKPEAGQTVTIAMREGTVYHLDFLLDDTRCDANGPDMTVCFEDTACLVLRGFFPAANAGDFFLEFPDGLMVSGKDMADVALLPLNDFSPSRVEGEFVSDPDHPSALVGREAHETQAARESGLEEGAGLFSFAHTHGGTHYEADGAGSAGGFLGVFVSGEAARGASFAAVGPEYILPHSSDESLVPMPSPGGRALAELDPGALQPGALLGGVATFMPALERHDELLEMQDLLSSIPSTRPEQAGTAPGAQHSAPVFESLFLASQDLDFLFGHDPGGGIIADSFANHPGSQADALDDSADMLMLAFLRMSTW
ncbi:hypothetical protein LJC59_07745 [Desulfovibrio sp. OttesenSCG-928-A18]|nr:hypothetical protein [Desulfovibrio sp. OttesenSCG-928-A18]